MYVCIYALHVFVCVSLYFYIRVYMSACVYAQKRDKGARVLMRRGRRRIGRGVCMHALHVCMRVCIFACMFI